ncbi:hypothetical protein J3Q64DRAFT_1057354 [Phycomyces blakesleeanus]|uniref:Uncharacterized protein n=2 Tax=Phycomyces blakesleeanus TaxID=4837 RepID=A0A162TH20_PHYB8|nr:hypothetical protein PHYBLDRAFT_67223 [Phycomyces blakesleeanus NRRL 1555(-)]OAD67083.1 hypothetical protein PHYBLDRAFT_67223 [Phycomyces blakesleeanus NRRL 1555(-)]|eukprot:XP_018285123.1 hypothetical protein PHYBLDRAFT_67223 [Phycomyces blakesleeanus NRRL 1555(-)]
MSATMNEIQSPNVSQNHYLHSNPMPLFESPGRCSNNQANIQPSVQTLPQPTIEAPPVQNINPPDNEQPTRIPVPVSTQPKPTTTIDRHFVSVRTKRTNTSTRSVPSYMSTTLSFQNRHLEQKPATENSTRSRNINTSKRSPKASRIPRYRPTRNNSAEENKGEIGPGEEYIPMAARVKIFENNLGNGLVPTPKVTENTLENIQPFVPHKPTLAKSPFLLTRQRSYLNRHQPEQAALPPTTSSRSTSSVQIQRTQTPAQKSRAAPQSDDTSYPAAKRQRKMDSKAPIQPFRFATEERALHYLKGSQVKVDAWKGKEQTSRSEKTRSTIRVAKEEEPRNPRKRKQEDALS